MDTDRDMGITRRQANPELTTRADLAELAAIGDAQIKKTIPQNTRRAYAHDLSHFAQWASDRGLEAMPAAPDTVRLYIIALDIDGKKPATIARRLSSISKAHRLKGFLSPIDPAVKEQLAAIRRERGTAQRKARPLLAQDIKRMIQASKPDVIGKRNRALLLVGFGAALRRSEIAALDVGDIEINDEGAIVTIRRSKTDQTGQGERIAIPRLPDQAAQFCPVRTVAHWIQISKIDSGPLFRPIGRAGRNVFFSAIGNGRLNNKTISDIIKGMIQAAGMTPAHYSAHSLRAGWATEAARTGLDFAYLKQHTRHRSSTIAAGYIREANLFKVNPLELFF